MSEQKQKILETIGKVLPDISEANKVYLMGFLEGLAATANNQPKRIAQQDSA